MKIFIKTILLSVFLLGISNFVGAKSDSKKQYVPYTQPRTFDGYILQKRSRIKFHRRNTNRPRFRLSQRNTARPQIKKGINSKRFATPAYERATRSQVQRAGIFCRFVEQKTPDTNCLRTVDTSPTQKKIHTLSSRNRYNPSSKNWYANPPKKEIKGVKRTFSRRYRFSRSQ